MNTTTHTSVNQGDVPAAPLTFCEDACTVEIDGMTFTSGGSFVWPCRFDFSALNFHEH